MAITDQDRRDWAHHPVTQELVETLKATRQDTMEAWAHEKYPTDLSNASALGGIRVLDQQIDLIQGYLTVEDEPQRGASHESK